MSKREEVLPDNYPVHPDYFYVCDGEVRRSPVSGYVADLKQEMGCSEVRNCDLASRGLLGYIV